jgi:hypothetical protein
MLSGGSVMDNAIERGARNVREETLRLSAPMQAFWRATFFDVPLSFASETLRFVGSRLQAHGEHLASLNSCRSVPEFIDANSQYVRGAMDAYGQETTKLMEDVRGTMGKVQNQAEEVQSRVNKAASRAA